MAKTIEHGRGRLGDAIVLIGERSPPIWPKRHSRARNLSGAACDTGGFRHPEFEKLLKKAKAKAPARSLVSIEDVGAATGFLAHDAARPITVDTIYVDGGYHVVDE